ncbi:FHA domain-containing protein [Mycobacterium szulgai]|uniref:FHA domain-containing protein n=1 Tax=Mycobacterium szulgai TaxID=1787 RepID=A0A1X2DQD9_MYCSZ|nr:FHA domain-containing protein [Mycobacterium szulgai]ORW90352.1 hypothetical protein AWC27_10800 [Mycobacterium szulgai]
MAGTGLSPSGSFRGITGDNEIVLDDPKVSPHHATIIDTCASSLINYLRSANGVALTHPRVRGSATLCDGDVAQR